MRSLLFVIIISSLVGYTGSAQKISKEEKRKEQAVIKEAISYARSVAMTHVDIEKLIAHSDIVSRNLMKPIKHRPAFISYINDGTGYPARYGIKNLLGRQEWEALSGGVTGMLGPVTFMVPKDGATVEVLKDGRRKHEVDTLVVNFEEGKFYSIFTKVNEDDIIEFSFRETDPIPYEAYQSANPNRVSGTWSGVKKTISNTYSNRFTFTGNKVRCEGDAVLIPKKRYVVEGTFMYNENTIVIFPDKITFNGKDAKEGKITPYIWYYTLNENELRLESDSPYPSWGSSAIYTRLPEQAIP